MAVEAVVAVQAAVATKAAVVVELVKAAVVARDKGAPNAPNVPSNSIA